MKKFVTTLVSLFAVLTLAVGFTACKDGEEVIEKQVNEEQWKTAVDYFSADKDKVDINGRNCTITYKYTNNGKELRSETLKIDNSTKVIYELSAGDYSRGDDIDVWSSEGYYWEDGGKVVDYSKYEATGEEADEDKEIVEDYATIDELILILPSYSYLGNLLSEFGVLDKFGAFTYDEEAEAYCGELQLPDDEDVYKTQIYFENYKIVKVYMTTTYTDANDLKHDVVYECTASYGNAKVTIPQAIKDMPLSEEN